MTRQYLGKEAVNFYISWVSEQLYMYRVVGMGEFVASELM